MKRSVGNLQPYKYGWRVRLKSGRRWPRPRGQGGSHIHGTDTMNSINTGVSGQYRDRFSSILAIAVLSLSSIFPHSSREQLRPPFLASFCFSPPDQVSYLSCFVSFLLFFVFSSIAAPPARESHKCSISSKHRQARNGLFVLFRIVPMPMTNSTPTFPSRSYSPLNI